MTMNAYKRKKKQIYRRSITVLVLLFGILFCSCGKAEKADKKQADRTVRQYEIPGLTGYCVDEAGEYLYCTVDGSSSIYQYGTDGSFIGEIPVTADDGEADIQAYPGEKPASAVNLTGLCINGDKLYCFRHLKGCVVEIDLQTGTQRICGRVACGTYIAKAAALPDTLLFLLIPVNEGKQIQMLDLDTGTFTKLEIDQPVAVTNGAANSFWLEAYDEDGWYFQEYRVDTKSLSEKYRTNFTDMVIDISYNPEENAIYGYLLTESQYVRIEPQQAAVAARFPVQKLNMFDCNMMMAGTRLFVSDTMVGKIYSFEPLAYVADNKPLKGYMLDLSSVPDWSGYNIDLEEMTWDELALKVLAGDSDYDFVVLNTDMPQALAIRDAMAYYPIPKDRIARYLEECYPYVREASTYRGDIWMLPVNLYMESVVYREDNLAEYGIRMEDIKNLQDLYEAAQKLYDAGQSGRFDVWATARKLLKEYIRLNKDNEGVRFDTEEFRQLLDFWDNYKDNDEIQNSYMNITYFEYTQEKQEGLSPLEMEELRQDAFWKTVCFERVDGYRWDYEKYAGREGFHVCGMPTLSGEVGTYPVLADIIIINPNAPNLDAVLDFVEDMSNNYIANPGRHLSAEESIYGTDAFSREVYELYGNGEIDFEFPDELFTSYYAYILGEITDREAVIAELNRTVNMYLGE